MSPKTLEAPSFRAVSNSLCTDINKKDKNGDTLLSVACKKKNEKAILFWYSKGANFHIINNEGRSAYSQLKEYNDLSSALQSLKDQLILNEMIDDQADCSLSL